MKVLRDITNAIKDIPRAGLRDAMGGLFFHSTIPCWLKYQFICRRKGHEYDGYNLCWKCWREVD